MTAEVFNFTPRTVSRQSNDSAFPTARRFTLGERASLIAAPYALAGCIVEFIIDDVGGESAAFQPDNGDVRAFFGLGCGASGHSLWDASGDTLGVFANVQTAVAAIRSEWSRHSGRKRRR